MRTVTPLDQPRALGRARVSSKRGPRGSVIDGLRQAGALKLLFPGGTDHLETIVINTSGGVTGGDHFVLEAEAGTGSALTLTTQAAERGYRAQPDQTGMVETHLKVADDARLNWLPQEMILFDGSDVDRRLTVDLNLTARFLMVEPIVFGRAAMGEDISHLRFHDRIEVRRAGQPLYRDGLRLEGPVADTLDRPAVANGARTMASLLWVAPEAAGALNEIRDLIGSAGGASMLADDVLVLRLLAGDGFELRRHLVPVLDRLTDNTLPRSWRL